MLVGAGIDAGRKAAEASPSAADGEAGELRSILDSASDGIIVIDRDARILSANRSAPALFGREAGDFAQTILTISWCRTASA